ncbi:MAG: SBBP repeat-containing protein [Planctomycetes bacterium]|nr:SBBP repeat-containing protein [Planctomycetota bacterium]
MNRLTSTLHVIVLVLAAPLGARASPLASRPLAFEPNRGQTDPRVAFLARGSAYAIFLSATEAVLVLHGPGTAVSARAAARRLERGGPRPLSSEPARVIRMKLLGANPAARPEGLDELPGRVHHLIGRDPTRWRRDIPTYSRARFDGVYSGVDVVYYGAREGLELDLIVHPGADPGVIALELEGADGVEVDELGEVVLALGSSRLRVVIPRVQEEDAGEGDESPRGATREVPGRFVRREDGRIGIAVGAYDRARTLRIDPGILYATYLGGSGNDSGEAIAVDKAGGVYITGSTQSLDFPAKASQPGPYQPTKAGGTDVFVSHLSASGTQLLYSTYLGGGSSDYGWGIAVDALGDAYVTGLTSSSDFPTTLDAFQTQHGGGQDAFVARLNQKGWDLTYATYLGGSGNENGRAIAVDAANDAYVTGSTTSSDFPVTRAAFQTQHANPNGSYDVFVSKLNAQGTGLVYSTYLGGDEREWPGGIALECGGAAFVAGTTFSTDFPVKPAGAGGRLHGPSDAFLAKVNAFGTGLIYSRLLGGQGNDEAEAVAVKVSYSIPYSAVVTGWTVATDLPVTADAYQKTFQGGASDAFVIHVNSAGTGLDYVTYLGGSSFEDGRGIFADSQGHIYVAGRTLSTDFPTTANAAQGSYGGGNADAFLVKLEEGGGLKYSTFLGGGEEDVVWGLAISRAGHAHVTGSSNGSYPTTSEAYQKTAGGGKDAVTIKVGTLAPQACNCYYSCDCPGYSSENKVYCGSYGACNFQPYGTLDPTTCIGGPSCEKPFDGGCHIQPTAIFASSQAAVLRAVTLWLLAFEAAGARGGGPPDRALVARARDVPLAAEEHEAVRELAIQVQALYLGIVQRGGLFTPPARSGDEPLEPQENGAVAALDRCRLDVAAKIREAISAELEAPRRGSFERRMAEIPKACPDYETPGRCEFPHPPEHGHEFPFADGIDCLTEELGAALRGLLPPEEGANWVSYDANGDGGVDISDPVSHLGHLFLGARQPACLEALDFNADRALDVSDPVSAFSFLFLGGPPHARGPGCQVYASCPAGSACR